MPTRPRRGSHTVGRHGLVLGGGFAGMLAAHVLTPYVDRVTVVERDVPPDGPGPRRGVPQARHSHLLMGAGARTVEELLPGTLAAWSEAGAHLLSAPGEVAFLTKCGWLPRVRHKEYVVSCGRDPLDWVVRRRVLRDPRVRLLAHTEVEALLGDSARVSGARVVDRGTGRTTEIEADFVVTATGRSSRLESWWEDLGLPAVPHELVDAGTAYATRLFRPDPATHRATPGIVMIANVTGQATGGVLLPIQDGLWTATVIGMRGSEPPTGEDEFFDFAKRLPHPALAELIAEAVPQGPVRGFRRLANRRLRFDRVPRHPEGLVVLGDAACVLNPSHAHGMTVAAFGVAALRDGLRRYGNAPGVAGRVQRATSRAARTAWELSVSDDLRHPTVIGPRPSVATRLQNAYADRVLRTAVTDPAVARSLVDVIALARPTTSLGAPRVLAPALLGRARRPAPGGTGDPLVPRAD
ncbi:flavin-dependent dehydrogenase [Streptomyces sp. BK208]|uniref:FAD-dependent monooxygenase n=1 Tax=Streptomyces sp. BK208 TaxID=2512150 RepID=UPI0010615328|nr:FAD-dependent monooxygenase [Streptomyces sp. BK208]TDT42699.1 flavin-dependent dehydrogenase [Streptomyces sp. BK208]